MSIVGLWETQLSFIKAWFPISFFFWLFLLVIVIMYKFYLKISLVKQEKPKGLAFDITPDHPINHLIGSEIKKKSLSCKDYSEKVDCDNGLIEHCDLYSDYHNDDQKPNGYEGGW